MSSLGLRLRIFAGRLLPHTPFKRVAYGLLAVAAIAAGLRLYVWLGVALGASLLAARAIDMRIAARRRPRARHRPYFFEGAGPP